jgi:hypothetical protein
VNLDWVMMDPAVDIAVGAMARMFGLPRETVAKILRISLPLMAETAEANP